ncbi:MAG: hypothetical protein JWQ72_55, partial [Polaromonas sp.]|nr:hypothetical protein [Polaromonas sp.]
IRLPWRPPLWLWLAGGTLLFYLLSIRHFPGATLTRSTLFYLLWAVLGFHLANPATRFTGASYLSAGLVAAAGLAAAGALGGGLGIMNMQANKFPPNHLFFLFSGLWMALLLGVAHLLRARSQAVDSLAQTVWLKPFIAAGYSIYLWHGLGYTVGVYVGEALRAPLAATWVLAVLLSVAAGMLAAPVERWRPGRR